MGLIIWDGHPEVAPSGPLDTSRPLYVGDIGILVAPVSEAATTFVYHRGTAATVWTITHNMNRRPSVTVVDSGHTEVIGDVQYISDDQIVLTFSAAFAGEAYLN